MTFTLRESTVEITNKLTKIYQNIKNIALLTVGTGGGKTYGAIHTMGQYFPNALLLVFTTDKVKRSRQWENSVSDYNQVMNTNLNVLVSNYERTLTKDFEPTVETLFSNARKLQKPVVMILDEVHKIKLSSSGKLSKRMEVILKLAESNDIVTTLALSATPFSNSYLDLYPYFKMAGFYTSKSDFFGQHVIHYDKYFTPVVTDKQKRVRRDYFKSPEIIEHYLNLISAYVDTSQYKPECVERNVVFKLDKAERAAYNQIKKDFQLGFYEYPIQARMAQENLLATDLASKKDNMLFGLLEKREQGAFDNKKTPILIFYQYTIVYNHLKPLLEVCYPNYDILEVKGGVNLTDEQLSEPDNPNTIFLIQYESGGEGLDWQWSNLAIFYESPVKYEKFKQAKGRNVRNKEIMPKVYHYHFEYLNTIDSDRWTTNRFKRDFTDDISKRIFEQDDDDDDDNLS